jgi:hypothetical protein
MNVDISPAVKRVRLQHLDGGHRGGIDFSAD